MNILYCGDKNSANGLIISTLSLLKNVNEPLNIFVLTVKFYINGKTYEPISKELIHFLDCKVKMKNKESFVKLIDASVLFKNEIPYANIDTRFTPCCMLRLFADKIPELPERILYLDNDVICRKDFSEFYHQDLDSVELAGVLDYYGSWFFGGGIFHRNYLNSGVLLLNLKLIRESGLLLKCRKYCTEKRMFMPDQSTINKLAVSKKILPRKFNEQRKLKSDTVFQHFTTGFRFLLWIHTVSVKPWQKDRMHSILHLYEYDDLLEEYLILKKELESENIGEIYYAK